MAFYILEGGMSALAYRARADVLKASFLQHANERFPVINDLMAPSRMETIDDKKRCGGKAAPLSGVRNIFFMKRLLRLLVHGC